MKIESSPPQTSPTALTAQALGLALMAQRDNLIYQGAHAHSPEERAEVLAKLEAWHEARTDADWRALAAAEYGPGKAGQMKLIEEYESVSPIGQRR